MKLPSHKRFIADIESGEAKELKPQSRFRFACQCCGECCRRDVDILINPYDVFRLTRHLKITTTEFLSQYATEYLGPDSHMPLVVLKHTQAGHCVFLKGNRCSIWRDRPSVCRLYPLGKFVGSDGKLRFYLNPLPRFCRGRKKKKYRTLTQWLRSSGFWEYHHNKEWYEHLLMDLTRGELLKKLPKQVLWLIAKVLYDFDDALPRFEKALGQKIPDDWKGKSKFMDEVVRQFVDLLKRPETQGDSNSQENSRS